MQISVLTLMWTILSELSELTCTRGDPLHCVLRLEQLLFVRVLRQFLQKAASMVELLVLLQASPHLSPVLLVHHDVLL